MDLIFDATGIPPSQEGGAHPVGEFDFMITNATAEPTNAADGHNLVVEFTTPVGTIKKWYSLWNKNAKTVAIAKGQVSALCHAVGVYQLPNVAGFGLVNARGKIIIDKQDLSDPNNKYVEIKKVLDVNGNEPGKPARQGAGAPAAATGFAPTPAPAAPAPAPAPVAPTAGFSPPAPAGAVAAAPAPGQPAATPWNPNAAPPPAPTWGPPPTQ